MRGRFLIRYLRVSPNVSMIPAMLIHFLTKLDYTIKDSVHVMPAI